MFGILSWALRANSSSFDSEVMSKHVGIGEFYGTKYKVAYRPTYTGFLEQDNYDEMEQITSMYNNKEEKGDSQNNSFY